MTTTTTITATAAGELRGKRRRSGFLHAIPTTLFVNIPTDRDYARVLAQTEVVYDQLLEERRAKLERKISDKKQQFEIKHLELVNSGDMIRVKYIYLLTPALSYVVLDIIIFSFTNQHYITY